MLIDVHRQGRQIYVVDKHRYWQTYQEVVPVGDHPEIDWFDAHLDSINISVVKD